MNMKVFVYSKNTSKKLLTVNDVVKVETPGNHRILLTTADGDMLGFDTKVVKTTIYQN